MSDVFVSYARSTARQAEQIAEALRGLGFSVWRDDELPAHRAYAEVIDERLAAAKAVVWTRTERWPDCADAGALPYDFRAECRRLAAARARPI